MKRLVEIARGWHAFIKQPEVAKGAIIERLRICDMCPYKQRISGIEGSILDVIKKESYKYKCSKCGCYLEVKATDLRAVCPLNKW